MSSNADPAEMTLGARPRLRGVSHQLAFFVALPLAVAFALSPETGKGRAAAIAYGTTVAFMFGASGLYHLVWPSPRWRPVMRRIDHAGVYLLIAGSYTPIGLIVLDGAWRTTVLAVVWTGAALAILAKVCWLDAPKWLSSVIAIGLGWIGVLVLPQVWNDVGLTACALLVGGGVAYTLGGIIYARERPNPLPAVFGFHEIFHVLVIVAVALQYTAIAFFVLPSH